ncbi:hypothetical protein ABE61_06410 [Lysinibacillus sphaericus]|nr:hypothetical protein [Lysinibacillus sphaericus]MBG9476195.1 hypothetical protein [Lysinibacillus sphaericus]MBG9591609.1 hypothetical protein [Lysinibacillus sphaericus]
MPGLERERFIADTLYKKLWKHDNYAMSISDVAFFYVCTYVLIERLVIPLLKSVGKHFTRRFFLFLAEAMKKDCQI